jgi:hypothetical protein
MRNRGCIWRLTLAAAPAKGRAMKTLLLTIAASALLMACEKETIVQGGDEPVVNTANVVLPPSITATKTYRCKDSSLVYIDWLSDNQSANFRADETGTPVQLKAAAAGGAMVAEGYSLTGDAKAASITITRPGKGSQSCKS